MAMNNFFGQLLIDIQTRLAAQVNEIKWTDQDLGQLEHFEYKPSVSFPCALIDFAQANYSALAENAQIGDIAIQIRLGFAPFSASNNVAPTNVREKALSFYDIEQKVFEALMGWAPDAPAGNAEFEEGKYTQPFVRVSAITEHRDNDQMGLRVRVLTFSTTYQDESAQVTFTKHAAGLVVNEDIQ